MSSQGVQKNPLSIVVVSESDHPNRVFRILKKESGRNGKVCYVCITSPYKDVARSLDEMGFNTSDFTFIDMLSGHYGETEQDDRCVFVKDPSNLNEIRDVIFNTIKERNAEIVLFDAISSLLSYQENHRIVSFTHELVSGEHIGRIKALFIFIKESASQMPELSENLLMDLDMFAETTINPRT